MPSLTYRACKNLIVRGSFTTKEEMQTKLDVFYAGDRITQSEYEELTRDLETKE